MKEWDYSKNTIKPDEVTKGTHKKIWWICSNNHSYEATIPARRRGTGCPYCSGNKILVGFNDLATTNPELLEKWNYEKNNNKLFYNIAINTTNYLYNPSYNSS